MKFDAYIFDLDGVIVDTAKYHFLAWNRLAKDLGFDFTEEHNERLKGVSRVRSLEILLEIGGLTLSDEKKLEYAAKKNEWYLEFIHQMTKEEILPGTIQLFEELKKENKKISLASASKNAPLILEKLGLIDYFDALVDGNMVSKAKPDPEVFIKAAELLGASHDKCVVFEDAQAGVEAAKKANMYCVGIGHPSVLKEADVIVDGLHAFNVNMLNA